MQNIWQREPSTGGAQSEERSRRFHRLLWDDEQDVHASARGALVLREPPLRSGEAPTASGTAADKNLPSRHWKGGLQHDDSTLWTPSMTKDTTIHYDMDIVEDVGLRLEEFSRLKRLGQFAAAERYFQESLSDSIDLSPVAVEYADMLVEQGAYERLHRVLSRQLGLVGSKSGSTHLPSSLSSDDSPYRFLYKANLQLIQAFSAIQSQGLMQEAYEEVRSLERPMSSLRRRRRTEPTLPLDSAEVR